MRIFFLALLAALAGPAFAHDLVHAGTRVSVAHSELSVTPDRDWNKLDGRPGRNAEIWTLDGELLNNLSFYGGVESGRPIFREVDRRNRPLPRFQANMLPSDIPVLLESSYRIARDVRIFSVDSQEPIDFAGTSGIRFTFSFVGPDEIRRRGEAHGAIIDGKLYLITFEAPQIHFFGRDIAAFQAVASSVNIGD